MRHLLNAARFQLLITGSAALLAGACIGISWVAARQEFVRVRSEEAQSWVNNQARAIEAMQRSDPQRGEDETFTEVHTFGLREKEALRQALPSESDGRLLLVTDAQGTVLWRSDEGMPAANGETRPMAVLLVARIPSTGWKLSYFVPTSEVHAALLPFLKKTFAVGALGTALFGLIAFFLQRSFLRMEGVGRAAALLHDLSHELACAKSREEICLVVERQLTTRFGLQYVTLAAIRGDGFTVLRGPTLSEAAWRAAQQACALETGSVMNAAEGFRIFVLEAAGAVEPAIVAVFPWPQPPAAAWDDLTALLLANFVDQAFKSLVRLASLKGQGTERLLRDLQESLLIPVVSRSEWHSAHSFWRAGVSLSGLWFGELRTRHATFLILFSSSQGKTGFLAMLTAKVALTSLKGLFSQDVIELMSPAEVSTHLLKVFTQDFRNETASLACIKISFRAPSSIEYSAVGRIEATRASEGTACPIPTSSQASNQQIECGYGTQLLFITRGNEADDTSEALREAQKSGIRGMNLAESLATRLTPAARDRGGILIEIR